MPWIGFTYRRAWRSDRPNSACNARTASAGERSTDGKLRSGQDKRSVVGVWVNARLGGLGQRFEDHVVAERLQARDETAGESFGVTAGVVVAAELAVGLAGGEHVPVGDEHRVLDGAERAAMPDAGFEPLVLGLERKRRDKPAWRSCERERRRQDGLVDGGPADCGAVEAMEVVWPSGAALRGEASNRPQVHWLKTVVLNVVGKGAARSRQVWVGKMSDGRKSSAVDVSKAGKTTSKPGLGVDV